MCLQNQRNLTDENVYIKNDLSAIKMCKVPKKCAKCQKNVQSGEMA